MPIVDADPDPVDLAAVVCVADADAGLDGDPMDPADVVAVGPAMDIGIAVDLEPIVIGPHTIRFDGASHSSGVIRACIRCPNLAHKRCLKYRQVDQDPNERSMLEFLLAWALAGNHVSRGEHVHKFFFPAEEQWREARELLP